MKYTPLENNPLYGYSTVAPVWEACTVSVFSLGLRVWSYVVWVDMTWLFCSLSILEKYDHSCMCTVLCEEGGGERVLKVFAMKVSGLHCTVLCLGVISPVSREREGEGERQRERQRKQ